MKVSELTGAALDWAVAQCANYINNIRLDKFKQWQDLGRTQVKDDDYTYWHPSTDWGQAGLIIEREFITVGPYHGDGGKPTGVFQAYMGWDDDTFDPLFQADGPNPLIAAMRCYVASKLGDDIEVPLELK